MADDEREIPTTLYRTVEVLVDRDALAARAAARLAARAAADGDGNDAEPDDDETIPVAISSENPVFRSEWWSGDEYNEVLSHAAGDVDMTRARGGLPFMMSHRSYDGDSQHGIVENIRVDGDGRMRGDLRMSKAPRSQEIRQDILDGIRRNVSVGYIRGDTYEQTQPDGPTSTPTRRYRGWMPIEVSDVPVPADHLVGYGRSAEGAVIRKVHLSPAPAPKAQERTMPEIPVAPTGAEPAAAPSATAGVDAQYRERVQAITQIAEAHGFNDKLGEWLRSDASPAQIAVEASKLIAQRMKDGPRAHAPLDTRDKNHTFSFARAMIAGDERLEREYRGETGRTIDVGFEREMLTELRSQMPRSGREGVALMPNAIRAGIDSGTSTTGGPFKFTQPGDFITLLRNRMALTKLGAQFLSGLSGPVTFPKQNAAATAYWLSENSGSDATDSNLTTTTVSLAFKTLVATTSVSRQALFSAASGNYDLEAIIREDLARVIAIEVDLQAIIGTGASNKPLGIFSNTGAQTYALGSNGATMSWANWVTMETKAANSNADQLSGLGYLTNPTQRGTAKNKAILDNTASGQTIWNGAADNGTVNGYPALATNQIPSNLTKGTSTTVCSGVIFGPWSAQMVGQFGNGFEVLTDPYCLKKQGMIELTSYIFVDAANRYPEGFVLVKDAL